MTEQRSPSADDSDGAGPSNVAEVEEDSASWETSDSASSAPPTPPGLVSTSEEDDYPSDY